jgi:hypothetical protein
MAICAKCKTEESEAYEGGVPICITWANAQQETKLDTLERASSASAGVNGGVEALFDLIRTDWKRKKLKP